MTLKKQKFICLDCETTGLDIEKDRVIEIGVMCFDLEEVYGTMETLIDPSMIIPEESIAIHHITQDMVQGKPSIEKVLPEFLKFIGNHIIIGHGVGFDIEHLALAAERMGHETNIRKNKVIDTLRLARLYGGCPVNSLEQLRKHFNIPLEGAHRAMSDVIVNREVFGHLVKKFNTLQQVYDALSKPILLKNIPLGKHKGRPFTEVPLQYLQWMANKEFDQDLLFSVRSELKRRKQGNSFNQIGNPFLNL